MSNCPKCGRNLYANQERCNCGWRNEEAKSQAQLDRCGWSGGCPDVGTMRSGHDGSWFCNQHWKRINGISESSNKPTNLEAILKKRMFELGLSGPDEKSNSDRAKELLFTKFGSYANLLQRENEAEAKAEREAIQSESTERETKPLETNTRIRTELGKSLAGLEDKNEWGQISGG